jgi:hypothetical protein
MRGGKREKREGEVKEFEEHKEEYGEKRDDLIQLL